MTRRTALGILLTAALIFVEAPPTTAGPIVGRNGAVAATSNRPPATSAQGAKPLGALASRRQEVAHAAAAAGGATTYFQWLRIDPADPSILFLGGGAYCDSSNPTFGTVCQPWLLRSRNSGHTWESVRFALSEDPGLQGNTSLAPLTVNADGRHLYMGASGGISPDSMYIALLQSADGGATWQEGFPNMVEISLSPLSVRRVYGQVQWCDVIAGTCRISLEYSNDAGDSWQGMQLPPNTDGASAWPGQLIADPRHLDTAYIGRVSESSDGRWLPTSVYRSQDLGGHWTLVTTPTAKPPLRTFFVRTDPHEGKRLVGKTQDPHARSDRRYVSSDEGRTWRATTCPGDRKGTCPAFTVDNAFGNGASYAFVNNGIYVFHGGGAAERPLAIGARLPVRTIDLLDVQGGTKAGQPIYLLTKQVRGNITGTVYRSLDEGHSWQRLSNVLQALPAPAPTPTPSSD